MCGPQRAFWRQTVLPLVNRMTRAMSRLAWSRVRRPARRRRVAERNENRTTRGLGSGRSSESRARSTVARLNAATFLTDDEKRAAAGYALLPPSANPSHKYSPDQPRVPAGNPDGGQWTGGGGASPVGGRGDDKVAMSVFREWMKRNAGRIAKLPKPALRKPPDFLTRRPGVGKITGDVSRLTKEERRFAEELRELGQEVDIIPTGPGRSPDFAINGVRHELKNSQQDSEPNIGRDFEIGFKNNSSRTWPIRQDHCRRARAVWNDAGNRREIYCKSIRR